MVWPVTVKPIRGGRVRGSSLPTAIVVTCIDYDTFGLGFLSRPDTDVGLSTTVEVQVEHISKQNVGHPFSSFLRFLSVSYNFLFTCELGSVISGRVGTRMKQYELCRENSQFYSNFLEC